MIFFLYFLITLSVPQVNLTEPVSMNSVRERKGVGERERERKRERYIVDKREGGRVERQKEVQKDSCKRERERGCRKG